METSIQCYMVRVMVVPDLMGRSFLETYFLSSSDQSAIKDSFSHAAALTATYGLRVKKLEVFDYHVVTMAEGVSWSGISRMLYDSENLDDSIEKERPDFIG